MEGNQIPLDIELQTNSPQQKTVKCLGMTFENDAARRAYFTEKLREKLQDPEFRNIEGFPIGEDEDILALSDPPYYTACPNPFIEEFINYWHQEKEESNLTTEEENYHREPFAADVSEGKNDPIYNAHSYHTKVPHKAIMRYILHYTEPGDVVFDGFCGTGMTGVAAQLCGDKATVESLGYKVQADGTILDEDGKEFSKLGARKAILNDLSPAATFIAYNYNTPVDVVEFEREAKRILAEVEEECSWMYLTLHNPTAEQVDKAVSLLKKSNNPQVDIQNSGLPFGKINYTVWSDVFICPECAGEVVYWENAVDKEAGKVRDNFPCPHCNAELNKRKMERAWITRFDTAINETIKQAKQVPVLINYSFGKKRFEKKPDIFDLTLIEYIENSNIPYWFPTDRMPEGEESRRNDDAGITHVHHFYTRRNLLSLSKINNLLNSSLIKIYKFMFSSMIYRATKMNRIHLKNYFFGGGGCNAGYLKGTLYISSIPIETSIIEQISDRINWISRGFKKLANTKTVSCTITASASNTLVKQNSINYIFTDPPFSNNIMYSELNFLWESWLKNFTDNKLEAIENKVQGKRLLEYQELMAQCFEEYYRVLKPGRWMTVEFHNSRNSVWNAIQEAMQHAGFIIADVRTLDKKQGSFKQVNSSNAVKQDLVITAYKPTTTLEQRFQLKAGTEEACWEFIRTHLQQLPTFVAKNGTAETIAERQNYLLFDRMVAFHIQRGVTVPLSASEFYAGLTQRFVDRDEMFFLPEQVPEYDQKRMTVREVLQLELFVNDEASAVQWLKQQLTKKPQTFQEIHPQFLREISSWLKHEKTLELRELLEQNFLCYDGKGAIPKQIVSWLKHSSIHRDKINELEENAPTDATGLETNDRILIDAAKDKWYVPDPNQAIDLEKLRDRALLKEFEEYRQSNQKKLKQFRLEAVRAGFKKAWQEKNYSIIVEVAKKIPDKVLQEDQKLIMLYDNAVGRIEE
ncbi:DNA methyltransferase [Rivularia sp. UHCC 0363]|uniref:DNA methyltransferase n=1 Tax=Rivularia sp. UHCC 0363 TaxID=3110244 RepID=UPI002B205BA5|nr:DNA methyltransferase [Rivularia sp. UHCC 0363]MEA5598985.1 DNA methyltransferase [Rivularia sp. UHCC 0363]